LVCKFNGNRDRNLQTRIDKVMYSKVYFGCFLSSKNPFMKSHAKSPTPQNIDARKTKQTNKQTKKQQLCFCL